jgi:GrpB-like predicted nucleotidyltransferase (UPF0157 family)
MAPRAGHPRETGLLPSRSRTYPKPARSSADPDAGSRRLDARHSTRRLLTATGVPVVAIEHVGSTSVPGLAAKPVIDCDIVVVAQHVASASLVLESLGFEPRGELGIPERWAFWEPDRLIGTNTYLVVAGSLALRNHLAVRDVLRADGVLRDEYGAAKKRVAATAAGIYEYGAGKNDVVQRILDAAGLSEEKRESINSNQVPVTPRKR